MRLRLLRLVGLLFTLTGLAGCATLQQIVALRDVEFSIDRISDVRLAGIELGGVDSFADLGLADVGQLTAAMSAGDLPMDFTLHLTAENPADNSVDARLVSLAWTLFLQGRETLSGVLAEDTLLPRGRPTDVPLTITIDLIDFFEGSARDLLELALSLTGQGGSPAEVALEATPTVDTALGPIVYPEPITIVRREIG